MRSLAAGIVSTAVLAGLLCLSGLAWATADGPDYYRVRNVEYWDILYIRSGPGVKYEVEGAIPCNGRCVRNLGESSRQGKSLWILVEYKGVRGWVNSHYLGEGSPEGCS